MVGFHPQPPPFPLTWQWEHADGTSDVMQAYKLDENPFEPETTKDVSLLEKAWLGVKNFFVGEIHQTHHHAPQAKVQQTQTLPPKVIIMWKIQCLCTIIDLLEPEMSILSPRPCQRGGESVSRCF